MTPGAADILEAAEKLRARGDCAPRLALDPVNVPMIRHWVEALGDKNPRYVDPQAAVAPPATLQVWTMPGLAGARPADDPLGVMTAVLDDAGYTSVVATNCEQTYHRHLLPGERLSVTSRLDDVVGPKRTALGEGWFVTTHSERVARRGRAGRRDAVPGAEVPPGRGSGWRPAAATGQPGHGVLLGRHGCGGAADPAVRGVRDAASPAWPDVPALRRD